MYKTIDSHNEIFKGKTFEEKAEYIVANYPKFWMDAEDMVEIMEDSRPFFTVYGSLEEFMEEHDYDEDEAIEYINDYYQFMDIAEDSNGEIIAIIVC